MEFSIPKTREPFPDGSALIFRLVFDYLMEILDGKVLRESCFEEELASVSSFSPSVKLSTILQNSKGKKSRNAFLKKSTTKHKFVKVFKKLP